MAVIPEWISFEKGARGNFHEHPHLQIIYIAEGSFEFTIGEEIKVVEKGDSVYIHSGAKHGVICLKEDKLIDVFNPKREEFINT